MVPANPNVNGVRRKFDKQSWSWKSCNNTATSSNLSALTALRGLCSNTITLSCLRPLALSVTASNLTPASAVSPVAEVLHL
ncbi:hypothetical protein GOODEAATRI_007998 [Goodea atripinnis]|uniref:Uncharacterized protein n=1 Tax=Goodea atripinnis TaxID=208336 RepID=A0ABV0N9V2_9TELE